MTNFWNNNKGIILFLFLMLFFRTAIADWYHVPSGSMKPNILIGDRVWVNKLAYDVKVPFSHFNFKRHAEPLVGDVVVFESKQSQKRLIKRVIGLPGDRIEMLNNHLKINGKWVNTKPIEAKQNFDLFLHDRQKANYYYEQHVVLSKDNITQLNHDFRVRISRDLVSAFSSFKEVIVPAEHLLVLGDNRDNSADSRVIGMVPREELIGKAEKVIVSFDANNYYLPRSGRYFESL